MAGSQNHLPEPTLGAGHTRAAPDAIHDVAGFGLVPSSVTSLYGERGGKKSQRGCDIRAATHLGEPSFLKPAGHTSQHG